MQNRNIEERLQILNDYIQRTIDALNATRQVAVQTLSPQLAQQGGLSHTPWNNWMQPQFVQTPQGLVPVNPYFTQGQPMQQIAPNYGYGLQHSGFVPGFVPNVQGLQGVVPNLIPQVPYGLHQHQQQFVPNFGFGLQHSPMVPQWPNVTPWTNVPVGFVQYGVPQHLGVAQPLVQNRDLGINQGPQMNLGQTTI